MGILDAVGFRSDCVGKGCDMGGAVGGGWGRNLGACHQRHDDVMLGGRTLVSTEGESPQIRCCLLVSA
jgi:hypothetical protein